LIKLNKWNWKIMIKIITWVVIKWKQLGRTIWFPTANIKNYDNDIEDASFKINIILNWKLYNWAWVFRKNLKIFEAHIFNFNKDIYWKEIEIIILEKIRKNKKVNSLEEIKVLIESDIKKIKTIKNTVLTFWTFDKVHKWHKYFLEQAKKYWDKLITVLGTDKNIEKIKLHKPIHNLEQRIIDIKKLNISDEVIKWDENNQLKWLNIYSAKVICLWYDQIWYSKDLKAYINSNNLDIEIIRIKPFMENIYKSSLLKNQLN